MKLRVRHPEKESQGSDAVRCSLRMRLHGTILFRRDEYLMPAHPRAGDGA